MCSSLSSGKSMFAVNLIPACRGGELTAFRELWSHFVSVRIAAQRHYVCWRLFGVYQVNPHDFCLLDVFGLILSLIYDPGGGIKLLRLLEKFPKYVRNMYVKIKLTIYNFKANVTYRQDKKKKMFLFLTMVKFFYCSESLSLVSCKNAL